MFAWILEEPHVEGIPSEILGIFTNKEKAIKYKDWYNSKHGTDFEISGSVDLNPEIKDDKNV